MKIRDQIHFDVFPAYTEFASKDSVRKWKL